MKDVLCLATFVGKVACLALFVAVLRSNQIGTVQAAGEAAYCEHGAGLRKYATCSTSEQSKGPMSDNVAPRP